LDHIHKEIDMLRRPVLGFTAALLLGLLAACGSAPYTPVASPVDPLDADAYVAKVDSFVVLLDTSGSMKSDADGRPKIQSAQDLVASFNSAVPPLGFQAGLVIFGKGADSCWGYGSASTLYGLKAYEPADFANALGSIECAASTTPITEALHKASRMLSGQQGPTAVIIVSDFKWSDPDAAQAAVEQLLAEHGSNICLHTVKLGGNTSGDSVINSISSDAGCYTAVQAADITSSSAMSAYVADTLLSPVEPVQYEKHIISAVTLFDFDKHALKEQGKVVLYKLGTNILEQGDSVVDITVIGYTDSVGTEAYNQGLSERRAQTVKGYLMAMGIDAGIIRATGKGESDPVASNDTDAGREENRRVEVHVGTAM
jgi:OOP family OmpA-OmpF porin